ncbi:hypothetical protein [Sphingomonas yabuuchiae]|uniref:Uncharacterized protein n=1 Tax=Sphingomonas yabuuchiae TaxID=172044 RepID=A0AA40ZYW1_9SPHN|nr:hypothetical protein [Sphingomonas yabuuchiae]MBB4611599.1 hypothetical protein [Sphingomonas yabuuchiae]MBN3556883.1 hypothetical protein [Sphingomonas yabuuchiae]
MQNKLYGEWAFSTPPIKPENADHILGAQVSVDRQGRPEFVDIQYRTADGGEAIRQVRMDWLNALALLSILKSMQLDSGAPFPNDPRNPNWRAGDGKP